MNAADLKLAGVALFDAFWNRDTAARDALIETCEPIELVSGLLGVVAALAGEVAYMQGVEVVDVITAHRDVYRLEAAS